MSFAGTILDLDGTVYRSDALIPGADSRVSTLRDRGTSVLFITR